MMWGSNTGKKPISEAVVVTVSVVPLMEHVPLGIEQLAVSVGFVLKPDVLIANVNVLPGAPLCEPCGTVTEGFEVNVAVTVVFPVIEKLQVALALPLQAPDHDVNDEFAFGTAVKVIEVSGANEVPEGDCWIVPGPTALVES